MCLPRTKWGDLHLAAPSYNLVTAPVTMQDPPPYLPFLVSRDWLVSMVGLHGYASSFSLFSALACANPT